MKKIIYIILYILAITVSGYYISNKYNKISENIDLQISSGSIISFTGNTFSGNNLVSTGILVNTGITIKETETEIEKFNQMQKEGFSRVFNPPPQPSLIGISAYQAKSDKLNEYLKNNNFYFRNSQLTEGYLYIKLSKPIGRFDIFLYFHDSSIGGYPISGKIAKEENLIVGTGASQEFLFKLNRIELYRFFDGKKYAFDWLNSTLSNTNSIHFIGGYTTTSDGNYIKEIIITGK